MQKIKIVLPVILVISLILDLGAVIYVKNHRPKKIPMANSQSPIADSQQSISYYITTSQEFLNKARGLAENRNQTEADKQEILATINQALDLANQAIAGYPSDDRGFIQRAKIYEALIPFVNQSASLAVQDLQTAIGLNNQNPDYHTRLAVLYLQSGNLENAALSFYNAYFLSPTDTQALYNLADTLEKSGQLSQADYYLNKLLSLLPADDENLTTLKNRKQNIQKLLSLAKLETLTEPGSFAPAATSETTAGNDLIGTQELPLEQAAIKSNVIIASGESPSTTANTSTGQATIAINAKSGQGTIPAGQTSITIDNKNVTDSNQIVVTPQGNIQNRVLYLISRKSGDWFKVGVNSSSSQEIRFNWWIID